MIRYNGCKCLSSLNALKADYSKRNLGQNKLLKKDLARIFERCLPVLVALFFILAGFISAANQAFCGETISGEVLETLNQGSYTYMLVGQNGKEQWVAVPQVIVRAGDKVEVEPGFEMGDYTSPTSGRIFKSIIFSGGVSNIQRVVRAEKDEKSLGEIEKIEKISGPDGYSIFEVFDKKNELDGKTVAVRGKVVKTSEYEGKTWLRLVDGTGSRKRGNHKLVAVSDKKAEKGDVVEVRGTLAVNKSYGFLTYDVLLENATVEAKK